MLLLKFIFYNNIIKALTLSFNLISKLLLNFKNYKILIKS